MVMMVRKQPNSLKIHIIQMRNGERELKKKLLE